MSNFSFLSLVQRSHLPQEPSSCAFPSTYTDFQSETRLSWSSRTLTGNPNRNWSMCESLILCCCWTSSFEVKFSGDSLKKKKKKSCCTGGLKNTHFLCSVNHDGSIRATLLSVCFFNSAYFQPRKTGGVLMFIISDSGSVWVDGEKSFQSFNNSYFNGSMKYYNSSSAMLDRQVLTGFFGASIYLLKGTYTVSIATSYDGVVVVVFIIHLV